MFTIERAYCTGPRGGRNIGYCLAWYGKGEAPGARARRSGWYRHKRDAESARDEANRHANRLAARPVVAPPRLNDGRFLVALISPDKSQRLWLQYGPHTPDGRDATRFATKDVAIRAANAAIYGEPSAFWGSERRSAAETRRRMRGWTFEIVEGGI